MQNNRPFVAVVAIAIFMFGLIFGVYFVENSANTFNFLRDIPRLQECIDADFDTATIFDLSDRLNYCHQLIYVQSELNEFTIRRLVFQSQHNSDMVLLWMVVFITIAGVLLSGLQLYTSYRMASDGIIQPGAAEQASSLEIERGKIALRSSVTGLFILIISFAFFYVFVIFVYKIDDLGAQETAPDLAQETLRNEADAFIEEGGAMIDPPPGPVPSEATE